MGLSLISYALNVVGLADKAVSEARERVRAALIASGLALPARRITVNLAPADLPKEGSHYDLPIALGLMAAIGAIPHDAVHGYAPFAIAGLHINAVVQGSLLEEVAKPDASGLALLRDAADAMHLSARGYHRVLRVSRTLADLDDAEKVARIHIAEALSYRALADEIRRAA